MGLSGEDRPRIYEEVRVQGEGREEIQRESKQKQVSLGSLGIIGVVLAVGLPAILIGCSNGEPTPQTTVETATETAPVPESNLFDAAEAKFRGFGYSSQGAALEILEFVTLRERPLEGGGVGAEILVDLSRPAGRAGLSESEASSKQDVRNLGEFILWQVWPKRHFTVLVYDDKEAWEARTLCEQEHEGEPAAKFDEIEGGPICTRATQLEKEHLLLTVSRNPSTGQAGSTWIGPDQP